jgi:hypothetical protein
MGQRHGKGAFYYSNGSKYEGNWEENFKHGHGVFTFEDGTQYIGPFEKDRMVKRDLANKEIEHIKSAVDSPKKQAEKDTKTPNKDAKTGDKAKVGTSDMQKS